MKTKIAILSFLFLSLNIFAQNLSENEILTASKNLIKSDELFAGYSINYQKNITKLDYKNTTIGYVINLKPKGYIILTSSKNIYPVFGYSTENNFDLSKNQAFSIIIDFLYKEKLFFQDNKASNFIISQNNAAWTKLLSGTTISKTYDHQYGYWMNNVWGGVNCYDQDGGIIHVGNYFTPNNYSPGCVATSMSQILKCHNWPPRGTGTHTDIDNSGSSTGSYYAKFAKQEYDWGNMLNEYYYKHSTDDQQRAMGRLAYHCAVATNMDFENEGSTANIDRIPNALTSYFRFTGHYETRSWSSYGSRMRSNLQYGHPVILAARADNGDEHAFVCDGYRYNDGEEKYYHLNMGWWNAYGLNGWYRIFNSNFNVGGYNTLLSGIFDIMPKPYMNKPLYTNDAHKFYVRWQMPKKINVTAFKLEESYNNGAWTTVNSSITDTCYLRTVTNDGLYKYRVQPAIDSTWYADTYSNYVNVPVGKAVYLNFDGDDSFFTNDNIYNDLDVDSTWTFETWAEVDTYNSNDWSVIMDRKTVFSLYLIDDYDSDFAVRFAVRDGSGNIVTSLRSDSCNTNLELSKWFHIAVSFDGTTARLFINGNLVDEKSGNDFILTNSTNALNFGARYWGSYSRYLDGRLDEIRVSDNARYTDDFCPNRFTEFTKDDNTRLLLHLDNFTGTSLYDESNHLLGITLRDSPYDASWASAACPVVLSQPRTISVCGGDVNFGITAYNADNYQWQINNTGNFSNTTDGSVFAGSTTDTLNVNTTSLVGSNILRCIITNSSMFSCSESATLNVFDNCTVWNGTSWSNGEPDNTKTAVIDANYSTSSDMEADNIIINANDTLYIMPDNTFTTNYVENNGVLMLKANTTSIYSGALITDDLLNYGEMIAEKHITAPNVEQVNNQSIINSPLDSLFSFDNILNDDLKAFETSSSPTSWTEVDTTKNASNRKAYLVQTKTPQIITFKGTFNTGKVTYSLHQGWNLIYNPYPCAINWQTESGWSKHNIQNSIYTLSPEYSETTQNFSVFNDNINLIEGSNYINAMQGFFIYADNDNSTLSINNEAKVKTSDIQQSTNPITNFLRFEFENTNTETDEAVIYFSDTKDEDSYKITPLTNNKLYTYLLNNSDLLSIAVVPQSTPDTTITVGFKTYVGGNCTFKVTNFNFSVPVILKDNMTGDTTLLELGKEYQFSAGTHEPLNRFKIYFGNYNTNIAQICDNSQIYSDGKTIFVKSTGQANVKIYNALGQQIYNKNFTNKIQITNLQSGIYVIKINNNFSKKIIIK